MLRFPVSDAPGQHDDLIVSQHSLILLVFKGQDGSADQRLSEFIPEIRGAVGGFNQDVHRGLVQPLAFRNVVFPGPAILQSGISGHVHSRAGKRDGAFPSGQPVPYLSPRSGRGTVEGFHGCGKIMGLRF